MGKVAVVTGITGQDGALLSKFLLGKDYRVVGVMRRTSAPTDWRIKELGLYDDENFEVASGDLTDQSSLDKIMRKYQPDEVYNLASQSFVGVSWKIYWPWCCSCF
jgi:GDPmannose 4,6-dehydratase